MQPRKKASGASVFSAALVSLALGSEGFSQRALARPEGPRTFCTVYADAPACTGGVPACTLCHESTFPATWNAYGLAIKDALAGQGDFEQALPKALIAVEGLDSDMDGIANRAEISGGTLPGNSASVLMSSDAGAAQLPPNPDFKIGQYDIAFAYRRASVLYCGISPSYEDMAPFRDPSKPASDLKALLHERIEACLAGDYWLKEGLPRLADDRVRPIRNLGQDSQVFITIPLPDLASNRSRASRWCAH
jgi:hypothetical protein